MNEASLSTKEFKQVQRLIFELAGISLADSKQVMVQGRLSRRLRDLQVSSYRDYLAMIQDGSCPEEVTKFINALTTNKTEFFRERHHFEFLKQRAFPELKAKAEQTQKRKLRIWCSAASTGEEPFTIAMTVREFFGPQPDWDIRILASDIDTDVLERASNGVYSSELTEGVSRSQLQKYFDVRKNGGPTSFRANESLRELLTFRRINLTEPTWPIHTTFDIIFCRNVMIYFNSETQSQLVEHFAKYLNPNGYLIIGHSESLFGINDRFKALGDTVYQLEKPVATSAARPPSTKADVPVPAGKPTLREKRKPNVSATVATQSTNTSPQAFFDKQAIKQIIVGEVHASDEPIWISTLLGSCVAACLYDEQTGIGGMNHFMLPESKTNPQLCASFGVHAMELLINRIMNLGGDRRRLKAKLFGGGAVLAAGIGRWNIGEQNVAFARGFLETEGIPIVASYTGGNSGMKVQFHTHSTKAHVRLLDPDTSRAIVEEQSRTVASAAPVQPDVTLF
ncbi:MAG: CheR family methyltransferase [Pirellulaceae bacterium]|nr:hypothetical protein [Planctomycetales bacterium]